MSLIAALADDRRELVVFQDAEAIALMRECGIFDRLPQAPQAPGPWYAAAGHKRLASHFIIGAVISGLPDPAENGAVAYCFAKGRYTEGFVLRTFEDLARSVGADPGRMYWV